MHQHTPVSNNVLPAYQRNHTVYVFSASIAWKIHPVYDGLGWTLRRHHDHNPERPLQKAQHPQDGSLGAKVFYQKRAEAATDEGAERLAH